MIINVGLNKYYVERIGEGTPMVCFHGFTGSTDTWREIAEKYRGQFQWILIDLPGHGKSNTDYLNNMEDACKELDEVLDQLSLKSFYLMGYSMGGRTALVYAHLFPEKIKKLILESASPGLEGESKIERKKKDENLAEWIEIVGIEMFVDYWESIPLFDSHEQLSSNKKAHLRNERLSQTATGLSLSLRSMGTGHQPSMWKHLPDINFPVLLITGSLDKKFTELNQNMKDKLPQAQHYIFSGVGHAPHMENSESFGRIVSEFLIQRLN
ncbi:2-succinyl-6-hydroxy-2,4-cyclohexadiene-1-carboxylate synthase [Halalkalibacillus sediminis]|uniref:Putative 2-succinyl-6-hydroxy-2,4-cyclohexadiene-1-carboxylate synthase n=1 Tax=Halalkalibacillus sediminis TaxID=2018042 RepID=A0A2I0QUV4_9BACI|nr:2-succinyl-6-hydroxy-2,4-cyclohexadiene-1-carboxylate synthase [Halalkalibacillus sediminis]PKR78133.1 2-succinyl-6-hydroxy-2,4-cyclohexadiene-1-carboxylate synthase [Halalkalibacillus sediminis]